MLAGISAEYYVRLERGNARGASDDVLHGIARALKLDHAERAHLFDLARATAASTTSRSPRLAQQERVRPSVQRVLDAIGSAPAFVVNSRSDILAANALGEAFYAELFADSERPVNTARYVFLNPRAAEFFVDWDGVANDVIGTLRGEAGRDPYDKRLTDLIGELSTRSEEFRVRWAAPQRPDAPLRHQTVHHSIVGDVELDYETLALPGDPGQALVIYTAEPSSPSQQALDLLASWTSTANPAIDVRGGQEE